MPSSRDRESPQIRQVMGRAQTSGGLIFVPVCLCTDPDVSLDYEDAWLASHSDEAMEAAGVKIGEVDAWLYGRIVQLFGVVPTCGIDEEQTGMTLLALDRETSERWYVMLECELARVAGEKRQSLSTTRILTALWQLILREPQNLGEFATCMTYDDAGGAYTVTIGYTDGQIIGGDEFGSEWEWWDEGEYDAENPADRGEPATGDPNLSAIGLEVFLCPTCRGTGLVSGLWCSRCPTCRGVPRFYAADYQS